MAVIIIVEDFVFMPNNEWSDRSLRIATVLLRKTGR